jgi:hypothetical protein
MASPTTRPCGLGFGDYYNWHSFASLQGYYTLAIDRLGHGTNPQHPDPFSIVEGALQIEIMHQLIESVRSNAHNPLGQQFEKIAYVSPPDAQFMFFVHSRTVMPCSAILLAQMSISHVYLVLLGPDTIHCFFVLPLHVTDP